MAHAEGTALFSSNTERNLVSAAVKWRVAGRELDVEASYSVVIIDIIRSV